MQILFLIQWAASQVEDAKLRKRSCFLISCKGTKPFWPPFICTKIDVMLAPKAPQSNSWNSRAIKFWCPSREGVDSFTWTVHQHTFYQRKTERILEQQWQGNLSLSLSLWHPKPMGLTSWHVLTCPCAWNAKCGITSVSIIYKTWTLWSKAKIMVFT